MSTSKKKNSKNSKKFKDKNVITSNIEDPYFNNENIIITDQVHIDTDTKKYIFGEDRRSRPVLTRYEYARILGIRSAQIARGAIVSEEFRKNTTSIRDIAKAELLAHQTPLNILRRMPGGLIEIWSISEMIIHDPKDA